MGLLDTLKGLFGQAKSVASEHPDQVNSAMAKAEGILDDKTGHKFTSQIHTGGEKAAELLEGQQADDPPQH